MLEKSIKNFCFQTTLNLPSNLSRRLGPSFSPAKLFVTSQCVPLPYPGHRAAKIGTWCRIVNLDATSNMAKVHNVTSRITSPQPRSQGPLSTSRKYPGSGWSRVYACQLKPHKGWVLNLILSTLSREVNVALLQTLIFWKGSKLFVGDPAWPVPRLYLNCYEDEMLIEGELCLCFIALLKNRKQPASNQLTSFSKRIE